MVPVGVVSAPALGQPLVGGTRERRVRERRADPRLHGLARSKRPLSLLLDRQSEVPALARRAWHARGLGDFWAHMLVAEGAVDGAVDVGRA